MQHLVTYVLHYLVARSVWSAFAHGVGGAVLVAVPIGVLAYWLGRRAAR